MMNFDQYWEDRGRRAARCGMWHGPCAYITAWSDAPDVRNWRNFPTTEIYLHAQQAFRCGFEGPARAQIETESLARKWGQRA